MISLWEEVEGSVETEAYHRVILRLKDQLLHAQEWRDVINSYFYRKSGIPDLKGREIY